MTIPDDAAARGNYMLVDEDDDYDDDDFYNNNNNIKGGIMVGDTITKPIIINSSQSTSPHEEKRIVTYLTNEAESNLNEGNLYFVVSNRWYRSWQVYTDQDDGNYLFKNNFIDAQSSALPKTVARPGPIDNSDIILNEIGTEVDELDIKKSLQEVSDYHLVPQQVWERLIEWYGGGPPLPRKMISEINNNKKFKVEVYPLYLNLLDSRDNSQSIVRLSQKASFQELYEKVCKLKHLDSEKVRIWDYFNQEKIEILENSNKTIEKSELQNNQDIFLEVQVDGPSRPCMDSTGNELALILIEPPRSPISIAGGPNMSNGYSSGYLSSFSQGGFSGSGSADIENFCNFLNSTAKPEKKGLAGLQNLGNTCFMNSALQCLLHTPPIVEYFLQDYSDEINMENPLGLKGELAITFGELLRKLWDSGRTVIAPRAFKTKLGIFAPQFSGYNQHDSQELLAFLLDGLHEDLNRVKQKPYFEAKDSDGRPDEEVAEECWRNHKARNDSIIVDVCQGQYKSTLVCPACKKISITFDPFMYLSLPIPSKATRTMTVTVFYGDGSSLPTPLTVIVKKNGNYQDLTRALATACFLRDDESLLLAEVYSHKIHKYLEDPLELLSNILDVDRIVAYRVPKERSELSKLEICHRNREKCWYNLKGGFEWKLFLTPLVTYVEKPQTKADIELAVKTFMFPLKKENILSSINILDDKENNIGSEVAAMEESANSSSSPIHSECVYDELDNSLEMVEMMSTSSNISISREIEFQLCITDDYGYNCRPILKDSKLEPRPMVNITLDWTEKQFDLYDPSYLKDLPVVHKSEIFTTKTKQETVSLFSCLDAFLKEEPLGPDDMWYCPSCKEHRQATKKLDLWRLPEILVFHLKRFSYSRYLKNKLETFVDFDIHNLDLSKYVKYKDASGRPHVYELYAISNHYGGLGGGHYSAYAKLVEENRWYDFDDSRVSLVDEDDVKTSAAYVLFYKRVENSAAAAAEESSQSQVIEIDTEI